MRACVNPEEKWGERILQGFILSNYSGPPIAGIMSHLTDCTFSGPGPPGLNQYRVGCTLSGPPVPGTPPRWKYEAKPTKSAAHTATVIATAHSFLRFTQYHFLLHYNAMLVLLKSLWMTPIEQESTLLSSL
jgi:hypothetical protein